MQETEFEIDREAVEQYFRTMQSLPVLALTGFFGIGLILAWIHYYKKCKFSRWICKQQANNLRYWIEGNKLRVDGGVYFLYRSSIPLERITDVALVQGPLLRHFGIWVMRIKTAGTATWEAALIGVREPEKVRELILSHQHVVHNEKMEDAT
jgi:uncharacterized membrane protein YdbT with pleckstrin-like domain